MTPSSSASTPRSCISPASVFKTGQATSSDESYFSHKPPSYPNIPASTPLVVKTSPSSPTEPTDKTDSTENSPLHSDPEMLQRIAKQFPAPPTLSLSISSLRHSASESSAPRISTFHRPSICPEAVPSPMDRSRRSVAPSYAPAMEVSSFLGKYTFHVVLPPMIQPEMITISANKGDKLKVVADAWHMESDCHYEWQITFAPRDIDMTAIQARFEANGHLFIDVRRQGGSYVVNH